LERQPPPERAEEVKEEIKQAREWIAEADRRLGFATMKSEAEWLRDAETALQHAVEFIRAAGASDKAERAGEAESC
jgi:hypothetical protein